ncbi:MAG: hypothetical protein EOP22_14055 [Hyphomicrobiales bacterium]|nr:MAG: hypothetical protein EOP22_14055 [Hyphomicrobiales bacterium]
MPEPARPLRIAVVAHVFFPALWPELAAYIANIPAPFTLFVTLPEGSTAEPLIRRTHADAEIRYVPNVGRDVAPFLSLYPALAAFDVVCKLHTKRDGLLHREWRLECLKGVLESRGLVTALLAAFAAHDDLLLAGAADLYLDGPRHVAGNLPMLHRLQDPLPTAYGFFAGTMFWARPALFADLAPRFPAAAFSVHRDKDGHLEHALERLFGARAATLDGIVALTRPAPAGRTVDIVPAGSGTARRFSHIYHFKLPLRHAPTAPLTHLPLGALHEAIGFIQRLQKISANRRAARRAALDASTPAGDTSA